MARNTSEKRDTQGMHGGEHPEKSSLLAFLRQQRLEDSERIRLHLTHCSQCQQTYADLLHNSKSLDILNQMSRYQRYPELSPTLILRQAQRAAQKQTIWSQLARRNVSPVGARFIAPSSVSTLTHPRPKKSAVRLVSLPAAFGLLLISMTVIVVLAYALAHFAPLQNFIQISPGGIVKNVSNPGGLVAHGVTPTPSPAQIVTSTATPTVTMSPTATPGASDHKPFIAICPVKLKTTYILYICGYNFKPGDKVQLTAMSLRGKIFPIPPVKKVDANGKFATYLMILFCKDIPQEISAKDISSKPVVSASMLINLTMWGRSLGDCAASGQNSR